MRSFLNQGLKERETIDDIVAYVRAFEQAAAPHSAACWRASRP